MVQDKEVRLEYVNTKEQIDDIFTKLLPKDAFLYLRGKIGVIPLSEAHQIMFSDASTEHFEDQTSWCSIDKVDCIWINTLGTWKTH